MHVMYTDKCVSRMHESVSSVIVLEDSSAHTYARCCLQNDT